MAQVSPTERESTTEREFPTEERASSTEQGPVPGLSARVELTVTDSDTAQAVGSGDVPVLGTPRVLALVEAATVAATATRLPAGATTVGVRVELEHRAATPIGRTVTALAHLTKVDGRKLLFEVTVTEPAPGPARDGGPDPTDPVIVAEGRVERLLVDRRRFVERALRTP
nr:thioesterase [Micromonospora sp. DSM 115978]